MQKTVDIESLQPAIQELERAIQWVAQPTDLAVGHRVAPVIQTWGKKRACAWFGSQPLEHLGVEAILGS